MSDEPTSDKTKASFWRRCFAHYYLARQLGRWGRWRSFVSAIRAVWRAYY